MYIVLDVINYINCKDRVTLSLSGRKTHLDRYRYTRKEPLILVENPENLPVPDAELRKLQEQDKETRRLIDLFNSGKMDKKLYSMDNYILKRVIIIIIIIIYFGTYNTFLLV